MWFLQKPSYPASSSIQHIRRPARRFPTRRFPNGNRSRHPLPHARHRRELALALHWPSRPTAIAAPTVGDEPTPASRAGRRPRSLPPVAGDGRRRPDLRLRRRRRDRGPGRALPPRRRPGRLRQRRGAFGNERGRPHEGQDIFAPAGTKLISPLATTVIETGADGGRGNWAALYDESEDRTFVYFHMIEPAEVQAGRSSPPATASARSAAPAPAMATISTSRSATGRDPYGTAERSAAGAAALGARLPKPTERADPHRIGAWTRSPTSCAAPPRC